jgi:hypothetical protein
MHLSWNAFHDIICGTLIAKATREALRRYVSAEKRAVTVLERLMLRAAAPLPADRGRPAVLCYNSLPYPRREILCLPSSGKGKPRFTVLDLAPSSLCVVPAARRRIPSRGRCRIQRSRDGWLLANGRVRVRVGRNGTLRSLVDLRSGLDLADPRFGMNRFVRQPDFGDLWMLESGPINGMLLRTAPFANPMPLSGAVPDIESRTATRATDPDCLPPPDCRVLHDDPLQVTLEVGYPPLRISSRITLRLDEALVRFRTHFVPTGCKYRLRVAFSTAIRSGTIRHSVPCGHIRRPEGEYAVQQWIDYADRDRGLLLVNRGLPGNNVTGNVMLLSLFRAVSLETEDPRPWYEEGEPQTFEYAIMPFRPGDPDYRPARTAACFNRPVHRVPVRAGPGAAVRHGAPVVELRGDGAELMSVRRRGRDWTVRLYESRGRRSSVKLCFPRPLTDCRRGDATGENMHVRPHAANEAHLSLRPFEIVTLKVRHAPRR